MKRIKITEHIIWHARRIARRKVKTVLGRCLKSNEIVHHVDFNPLNTKNSNLLVCTRAYHMRLHRKLQLLEKVKKHKDKIKRLYAEGYSGNYIAKDLKFGHRTVRKILKYLNVKIRTKGEAIKTNLKIMKVSGYYYHTDEFLIKELKRVSVLNKERPLSERMFRQISKHCSSTVRRHFGSWNNAKRIADIS